MSLHVIALVKEFPLFYICHRKIRCRKIMFKISLDFNSTLKIEGTSGKNEYIHKWFSKKGFWFLLPQDSDSHEDLEALEKRLRERALQSIQSKEEIERERQLREKALQSMKHRGDTESSDSDSDWRGIPHTMGNPSYNGRIPVTSERGDTPCHDVLEGIGPLSEEIPSIQIFRIFISGQKQS